METHPTGANPACAQNSSESGEGPLDEEQMAMRRAEEYVLSWIFRMEQGGVHGRKDVPPMVIIHFPDLIKITWYPERLVPWRPAFVEWVSYLEYLRDFFDKHCVPPDLSLASYRCLEMEEIYLASPANQWAEGSLSKAIMERSNYMTHSEGESAVAAAGFMCIAEEALLMSELAESETYQITFSDDVRQHAFNLMGYKGSQSTVVCAALLGMMKEAELLRYYLTEDDPHDMLCYPSIYTGRLHHV